MKEKDFNEVSVLLTHRKDLTGYLAGIEGYKTRLINVPGSMHLHPLKVRSEELRSFYELEIEYINKQLTALGLELSE